MQALGNDQVELTVRDTGTGIPEHELAHVFDRFHRVEGARGRSVEGSGIGLALVHELTKLHGGTVAVKSKGGSGSTFQVTLPLGAAHLPADRVFASPTMATTQARSSAFIEEALRWLPDMSTTLASDADEAVTTVEQMTQPFRGGIADGPQARVVLADDNADMRAYVRHLLETLRSPSRD